MWLSMALVLGLATGEFPQRPFVDLSFDAALAQAKRADKMLMAEFSVSWSGQSKLLENHTWKDPSVVEWLEKRCVAVKIDAREDETLAQRFHVTRHPTILFVRPDGTELDRIIGYRDAPRFLRDVDGMLAGDDGLARARAALVGRESDLNARTQYARELVKLERHGEALAEYLSWFDGSSPIEFKSDVLRVGCAQPELARLAKEYPPASQAMATLREAAESRLKSGSVERADVMLVCSINRSLFERNRGIALYDALRERGPLPEVVRTAFATELDAALVQAGRYGDFLTLIDDPLERVERKIESVVHTREKYASWQKGAEARAEWKRGTQTLAVQECLPIFEALVGVQRLTEAERVVDRLVLFADLDTTYANLVSAAASAGNVEFAKSVAERGFATLSEDDRVWLRAAHEELPRAK